MDEVVSVRKHNTMERTISILGKFTTFSRWLNVVAMVSLMAMVVFIFINVVLRYVFRQAITGSIEIVQLLMVLAVFCGLAYCQSVKGHVTMDVLVSRLRPKPQVVIEGITIFLSTILFGVVIWRTSLIAMKTPEASLVFSIPVAPQLMLISITSALLILQLLRQFLESIVKGMGLQLSVKSWLLIFGIPILILIGFAFLITAGPFTGNVTLIGILGVVCLFLFFIIDMPVGFVLMMVAVVFLCFLRGPDGGLSLLGKSWYDTVSDYNWSPLILFLFMGFICYRVGLGDDLFYTARKWVGHWRGGLYMSAILACTAFGAVVGGSLPGSVTMTAIALPEMKKYGYDKSLSIGTLTCAGTIGDLIPPSVGFIIYAVLSEQSVGKLFIAGIFPGLVLTASFMLVIYILCRLNPTLGPAAERSSWRLRIISLKSTWPIALLFLLVIGGIYGGVFTATEGGAIGAFGALVIALAMRRLTWTRLKEAVVETTQFNAMSFTILGGALMFGYFIGTSRLANVLAQAIAGMVVPPLIVMLFIVIILFVLGCFLPAIPLMLITVPIFLPIANTMGWNLIWFGVIMVMLMDLASITPPYGMNLFVIKGMTGVPMGLMFRSVMPFVWAFLVAIIIIIAFPTLTTWLPLILH